MYGRQPDSNWTDPSENIKQIIREPMSKRKSSGRELVVPSSAEGAARCYSPTDDQAPVSPDSKPSAKTGPQLRPRKTHSAHSG